MGGPSRRAGRRYRSVSCIGSASLAAVLTPGLYGRDQPCSREARRGRRTMRRRDFLALTAAGAAATLPGAADSATVTNLPRIYLTASSTGAMVLACKHETSAASVGRRRRSCAAGL